MNSVPDSERARPDLSPYQRNHSFVYNWIAQQLTAAVPEFEPIIIEHTNYYGEVLSHLLFGDLTRFVLGGYTTGQTDTVNRCIRFLERAARYGDDEVVNLVAVSFVENVGPWDSEMYGFISTWPDRLQELATEQGWPGTPAR